MTTEGVILSGNLKKKGNFFGRMIETYCEIKENEFIQYKNQFSQVIELQLPTTEITNVHLVEDNNKQFIIKTKNASYIFESDSKSNAYDWVVVIKSAKTIDSSLSIDDFYIISVIGRGFYGKVMLVQKKETNKFYALKTIHKSRLVEANKLHTVFAEKEILTRVDHPFIVKISFAFQNPSKFYIGLEYVPGGELFRLIQKNGYIPIDDVRIYAAEIGLALNFLHKNHIIYRDLKPENVMLDEQGHIKLTDFGLAKDVGVSDTAQTLCGTSEYLAPEIIKREPYSFQVDWWSYGIIIYEMIYGNTPFYNESKVSLFKRITEDEPIFLDKSDPDVKDFITKLLEKDPSKRATFESLRTHPFWCGLDFDRVLKKEIPPSYVPYTGDKLVPTNFDEEITMETPADSFASPVFPPPEVSFDGFSFVGSLFEDVRVSSMPQLPSSLTNC